MNVIRDEETFGLMMIPLLFEWGVRRCNVDGCTERPTTIVVGLAPNFPVAGFCEQHYQKALGETQNYHLVFDDFDAFGRTEDA